MGMDWKVVRGARPVPGRSDRDCAASSDVITTARPSRPSLGNADLQEIHSAVGQKHSYLHDDCAVINPRWL